MMKKVIVIGAGAWGGWTAFHLQKAGCQVTLIDKNGPGNTLAGSGGKTRIIRLAYGGSEVYTDLTERSFALWEKYTTMWNEQLLHSKPALWMFRNIEPKYAEMSEPLMKQRGYELDQLSIQELTKKYPKINFKDITAAYWEPNAAYLEASRSCGIVRDQFVKAGGKYLEEAVVNLNHKGAKITGAALSTGEVLEADYYVLACGPWLRELVPEMEKHIHISRQEVYYFETPDNYSQMPIWVEFREGDKMYYGIPDHFGQGFKFAYDERTWSLNPSKDDREITSEILNKMKSILANRFPELAETSVLKHHVCVYENSADGDFIIDAPSGCSNALMLAGSSGHGFKMGPAIGELATAHILKNEVIPYEFSIPRFAGTEQRKSQYEV